MLVDGYGAFHSAYERIDGGKWVDALTHLVGDGRQFGVHFVLTADRRNAFPLALTSAVPGRLVLRLANPDEKRQLACHLTSYRSQSPPARLIRRLGDPSRGAWR